MCTNWNSICSCYTLLEQKKKLKRTRCCRSKWLPNYLIEIISWNNNKSIKAADRVSLTIHLWGHNHGILCIISSTIGGDVRHSTFIAHTFDIALCIMGGKHLSELNRNVWRSRVQLHSMFLNHFLFCVNIFKVRENVGTPATNADAKRHSKMRVSHRYLEIYLVHVFDQLKNF